MPRAVDKNNAGFGHCGRYAMRSLFLLVNVQVNANRADHSHITYIGLLRLRNLAIQPQMLSRFGPIS